MAVAQGAMSYEDLIKALPSSPAGFAMDGTPTGTKVDMNGTSFSSCEASYKKGAVNMDIGLIDYKDAAMMITTSTMMWDRGMSYASTEEEGGSVTVAGHKGWKVIDKVDSSIVLTLLVRDRYLVTIEIDGAKDFDLARQVANAIKYTILAS